MPARRRNRPRHLRRRDAVTNDTSGVAAGRRNFVADAHRATERRFVVRAEEKLTAFVELQLAIRVAKTL
jgi:hypothetical protein